MASGTGPGDHARVIELGAGENLGGMTGVATQRGCDVLLRLDNVVSRQTQTTGVATGTVTRCSLEHAANMARLAARGHMRSGQRKTGCQMVEFARRVLGLHARGKCPTEQRQQQPHAADEYVQTA